MLHAGIGKKPKTMKNHKTKTHSVIFSAPEHEPGATFFGSFAHKIMENLLLYYCIM